MRILGIDPGVNGAFAFLDATVGDDGVLTWTKARAICDMPNTHSLDGARRPNVTAINRILEAARPDHIVLERVHAMPFSRTLPSRDRDPVTEWSLAQGYGMVLACCLMSVPEERLHLPTPSAWKRKLGVTSDKGTSVRLARSLNITGTGGALEAGTAQHDRAEAILLADFFRVAVWPKVSKKDYA